MKSTQSVSALPSVQQPKLGITDCVYSSTLGFLDCLLVSRSLGTRPQAEVSVGQRSRPQPSQQMESIYSPQGTSDLRTFCLLAASKHISQLKRVSAGPGCPPQEHFSTACAWQLRQPWGTGCQADSSSCGGPAWSRAAGE